MLFIFLKENIDRDGFFTQFLIFWGENIFGPCKKETEDSLTFHVIKSMKRTRGCIYQKEVKLQKKRLGLGTGVVAKTTFD